jgi:hypothetical protein
MQPALESRSGLWKVRLRGRHWQRAQVPQARCEHGSKVIAAAFDCADTNAETGSQFSGSKYREVVNATPAAWHGSRSTVNARTNACMSRADTAGADSRADQRRLREI